MGSVFATLTDVVTVVVTAVRFACTNAHRRFKPCPNQPLICIRRDLFCDSVDNCGMNADEQVAENPYGTQCNATLELSSQLSTSFRSHYRSQDACVDANVLRLIRVLDRIGCHLGWPHVSMAAHTENPLLPCEESSGSKRQSG